MKDTAIVILAAGNSSRFGSSKQLLQINNKTLLQHAIDEAVGSGADSVIVVTGANAEMISNAISNDKVRLVLNENWQQGMASSIVKGIEAALASGDIKKLIISAGDQPFVSSLLFNQLYQTQVEQVKSMVASSYSGTIGTPALFTQSCFDALLKLRGEEGAKKILQNNREDVATVDFPQGEIDIDTQKDYENLLERQKHA